jgi:carbon starvation protein
LIQGVRDPLGGVNSLWPLFGIANQMLATIALCLATTIILKMVLAGNGVPGSDPAQKSWSSRFSVPPDKLKLELQHAGSETGAPKRSPALALVTLVPLIWLVAVTFTAGVEKIWSHDPRIGFLAQAHVLNSKAADAHLAVTQATTNEDAEKAGHELLADVRLIFNQYLDAAVAGVFLILVTVIVLLSLREWFLLLSRRKPAVLHETEPVWLPDYAVVEGGRKFSGAAGAAALALALAKEWSGESHLERAQQQQTQAVCECHPANAQQVYVEATEQRFNGVRRCC